MSEEERKEKVSKPFDVEEYTRSITEGVAQAIRLSTIRERLGCGELIPSLLAAQTMGQSWEDINDNAKEMWINDARWALEASGTIDLMVAYQESEARRCELAEQLAKITSGEPCTYDGCPYPTNPKYNHNHPSDPLQ